MKIFVVENNYSGSQDLKASNEEAGWFLIADSAMTNTGKPFYLPENLGRVTVSLSRVSRIDRLGKNISVKFASRYYNALAPALLFSLPDYARQLRERNLPEDAARSFDRALFVGDFADKSAEMRLELRKNGETVCSYDDLQLLKPVDTLIPALSRLNTLKMGDVIVPGLSGKIEIEEGDFLEVMKGDERMFHVKVK